MKNTVRPGSRKRPPLLIFLFMIILSSLVLTVIAKRPSGTTLMIEAGSESEENKLDMPTTAMTAPLPFPVHVDGAVQQPGIYYLEEASILGDAVALAGGFLESADTSLVNLAMLCQPHMKIYIPREGEAIPLWQAGAEMQASGNKVDINRAPRSELMTLPGVGEATADTIIAFREEYGPFAAIEEIMQIPGIKEGRFSKLKDLITAGSP